MIPLYSTTVLYDNILQVIDAVGCTKRFDE